MRLRWTAKVSLFRGIDARQSDMYLDVAL
jgi:hypothetical protein